MKLRKRLLASIVAISMVSIVGVGCTKSEKTSKELSEINLTYVKSPLNVPSILQKQDNLFGKEFSKDNINVNFHEITSGPDQTQALAAGEIDFLHALGGTSALIAASNGVELEILNTYSKSPKGFMIITNDESIKSVEDLKGKKVAGPKGTVLHQLLLTATKNVNMSNNDFEYINMGLPEASAALADKSVDAALLAGPVALKSLNSGNKLVVNGEGLVDGILVTAVSKKFAENNPEIVERFKKVHEETLKYMDENYDEMISKVSKEVGLTEEETKEMFTWYDFNMDIKDSDIDELEKTQEFLIESGMQENKINIKDIIYTAK